MRVQPVKVGRAGVQKIEPFEAVFQILAHGGAREAIDADAVPIKLRRLRGLWSPYVNDLARLTEVVPYVERRCGETGNESAKLRLEILLEKAGVKGIGGAEPAGTAQDAAAVTAGPPEVTRERVAS